MRLTLAVPTVLTLLALGLAPHARAGQLDPSAENTSWKHDYPVVGRANVRVISDDGNVHVQTQPDAKQVSIRVTYSVKKWGLVIGQRRPSVKFENVNDVITVTTRQPGNISVLGAIVENYDIYVTMPVAADLSVRTGDGSVNCDAVKGVVRIQTGDGHITVHDLSGVISLDSGDGSVKADGLDGKLRARTGDGHMTLVGRFDGLAVRTGDGRVEVSAAAGSHLSENWSIESGDGSLSLRIPIDLKAFLDVRTGDGRINVSLPIPEKGRQRGHTLRGELNGGGPILTMRTTDGSVSLGLTP